MVYSISNSIGDHSATDSDHAAPPCALIPKLFPPSLGVDYTNVRFRLRSQLIDATHWANLSAGVS